MKRKNIIGKIHLWLGLSTGLVVFILGLTGAVYCFAPELQTLQPYRSVVEENKSFLPPSQIQSIAGRSLPGKLLQRIYYDAKDKAVMVLFLKKDEYSYSVFINPYSGKVLKVRNNKRDFLSVVLSIHRTLNIPYGHDIIRWSTVIFTVMLVSGIILWWPKNRRVADQAFKIRWDASPKRLNYDLHRVLGFYVCWIVIFTAITGLMFAFKGFSGFVYKISGADQSIVKNSPPLSDTSITQEGNIAAIDLIWNDVKGDLHHRYASIMFVLPSAKSGPVLVRANPEEGTIYKFDFRYYDQYSGSEIPGAYVWGRYNEDARTMSDYVRRMNYDIHVGAIFGLPGRVALFFVALVVCSLPVTGFYFWWGRKHKAKRLKRADMFVTA